MNKKNNFIHGGMTAKVVDVVVQNVIWESANLERMKVEVFLE